MMRADPDIIMVGEIRDRETAQIAIEAALTGHLVLSTLHTNDAPDGDHPPDRDGHRAVPRRLGASTASSPSASRARSARTASSATILSAEVLREQRLPRRTSTSRPTSPSAARAAAAPATRAASASTRS